MGVGVLAEIRRLRSADGVGCEQIARALPGWFGIEEEIRNLRRAAETSEGFVATIEGKVVGFVTLQTEFPESMELTWMAVDPLAYRQGVGRELIEAAIHLAQVREVELLLVKTLADMHSSPKYAQTRRFYEAMGFRRLTVLPEHWNPANLCLLLVRSLS